MSSGRGGGSGSPTCARTGGCRFDAVARYLQDVAGDDVADAGWRADEHVWVVRRTELEVASSFVRDEEVELATWCSGTGAAAAARRTTLAGDGGGRIEAESIWIHLGPDLRPLRLTQRFFDVYGEAAEGRGVATRLVLAPLPTEAERRPWPLRRADLDRLGHVNNTAAWQAVEELLPDSADIVAATIEYAAPIDLGDAVELRTAWADDRLDVELAVGGEARVCASIARRTRA